MSFTAIVIMKLKTNINRDWFFLLICKIATWISAKKNCIFFYRLFNYQPSDTIRSVNDHAIFRYWVNIDDISTSKRRFFASKNEHLKVCVSLLMTVFTLITPVNRVIPWNLFSFDYGVTLFFSVSGIIVTRKRWSKNRRRWELKPMYYW